MSNIVVLGSSGNIGAATLKSLAAKSSTASIIAGSRDPTSDKAKALATGNIKFVAADLSKPDTLPAALAGAGAVFVNTPGVFERDQYAVNGINAAKAAGAKHVIALSFSVAELGATTIFGKQAVAIEAAAKASGVPFTIVRLPLFIDNQWGNQGSIKGQGKIYGPVNPDALYTPVAVQDAGEAIASILLNPGAHAGKTYNITSPAISHAQTAAAFAKATGKAVEYVQVPYDAAKSSFVSAGWPEWQVDGILELFKLIDAASPVLNDVNGSATTESLIGHAALTIEQWTAQVGGAFA